MAEVEKRVSDGNELLAKNGFSRANMYSGDATESILTISTLSSAKRNTMEYFLIYANPYMASKTFAVFLSHFIVEVVEGWLQLVRNERSRMHRIGFYPIQRAITTGILREVSVFSLVGDMLRGLPAMYATFVGYDEVAHHSGVMRRDAMRVLNGLDKIGFIMASSEKHGPLAIGARGIYYLDEDRFEGENPLADFGPNAALHLRRENGFSNAPDLLVNSFYDQEKDEVAAFEELVGSHGGLGGNQSKAILVYPNELTIGEETIVGASSLHRIIKSCIPEK